MKLNRSTSTPQTSQVGKTTTSATKQGQVTEKPAPKTGWQPTTAGARKQQVNTATKPTLAPTGTPLAVRGDYAGPGFETKLDSQTNSRAVPGNQVTMLFDGVNSFAERNKMIDNAKESICLQTFIFNSDDTGWDLAKRLAEKAKQGVKVRVIYDAVGSGRADPEMFKLMRDAGVDVRAYGEKYKVWDLNDRWHEKHLIVDGKASVEGGMNIANEYALGGSGKMVFSRGEQGTEAWRDTDVKLEGPAVANAMKAFVRNWEEVGGKISESDRARLFPKIAPKEGGPTVRVVQHNPEVKGLQGTTDRLYLESIRNATKSITIENAYFLPPPEMRQALLDAVKRGVEVKVMTNSRASNDQGFVSDAARYFYDDMIKGGVQIYEKQGGTLHSKTATFDGQYSIVGSVNLNGRSKNQDSEDALAINDTKTAAQLEQRFASGLKQTHKVTLGELGQEGFFTNLKQWALSTMAWTF